MLHDIEKAPTEFHVLLSATEWSDPETRRFKDLLAKHERRGVRRARGRPSAHGRDRSEDPAASRGWKASSPATRNSRWRPEFERTVERFPGGSAQSRPPFFPLSASSFDPCSTATTRIEFGAVYGNRHAGRNPFERLRAVGKSRPLGRAMEEDNALRQGKRRSEFFLNRIAQLRRIDRLFRRPDRPFLSAVGSLCGRRGSCPCRWTKAMLPKPCADVRRCGRLRAFRSACPDMFAPSRSGREGAAAMSRAFGATTTGIFRGAGWPTRGGAPLFWSFSERACRAMCGISAREIPSRRDSRR